MHLVCDNYAYFKLVKKEETFSLYEYKPTVLKPLMIPLEPIRMVRRMRFIKEMISGGYRVYYLNVSDKFVGYCVVSPGGRRLKCTEKDDIIIGPYYISREYRGHGYAKILVKMTLESCTYSFNNAYCWIHKMNIPSIRTVLACGMNPNGLYLNVVGKFRKLELDKNGSYIVYKR